MVTKKKEYKCKTYGDVQDEVFKLRKTALKNNKFSDFCHILNHISNCKTVEQCNNVLTANYERLKKEK